MKTPDSIQQIIQSDFSATDAKEILEKVESIYSETLNVGHNQLIRSLLFLSKGSKAIFMSYFPMADPRDVVMEAEMAGGDKAKYFS
jgi:hypothetical protein